MIRETVWRWELTPLQAFEGFTFYPYPKTKPFGSVEGKEFGLGPPFTSAKQPMEGTAFTYQIAVSDRALNYDIKSIRQAQPELETSGDGRSGVQLFAGNDVIASLILHGHRYKSYYHLMVRKDKRGQQLGQCMLQCWHRKTKRPLVFAPQILNPAGARSSLAAQIEICRWAVENGKDVHPAVLDELRTGEQEAYMLSKLEDVINTGNGWTFQSCK